jgi:hypothetical protein
MSSNLNFVIIARVNLRMQMNHSKIFLPLRWGWQATG